MTSLTTQSKYYAIVVSLKGCEEKAEQFKFDLVGLFSQLGNVAAIVHDKDINIDKTPKTKHIHCVVSLNKRKQCSAVINLVADTLGVSTLAVSVSVAKSMSSCVQYLVHKNDLEKYQYPIEDIAFKWSEEWDLLMTCEKAETIDFETLFSICKRANNKVEVMAEIGISYYKNYRYCIDEIWKVLHPYD